MGNNYEITYLLQSIKIGILKCILNSELNECTYCIYNDACINYKCLLFNILLNCSLLNFSRALLIPRPEIMYFCRIILKFHSLFCMPSNSSPMCTRHVFETVYDPYHILYSNAPLRA